MAVRGGGPSRRSHTKSRKGCKTCKRRHIRCDESFPQCRNCTKHHVRCDYMDATTPEADSMTTASSERASPTPTPTEEGAAFPSRRPGSVYSDLGLSFMADPEVRYGSDHHLITNLLSIADNLDSKGASDLTTWVSYVRRHVALAPQWPTVNDALKGFSASQIAWNTRSPAAREQSLHYGGSALSGLHQAVGQFSKENADSVLITALLLISQSRDWLSWSSLLGGLSSITAAIESWESESMYPDFVKRINNQFASKKQRPELRHLSDVERAETFRTIHLALQQLRSSLADRPVELHWVDQIIDLIDRLQTAEPARTAEAEFGQLYVLRKWIFWLPVLLLQEGPVDTIKIAVIAHLYAVALALGPVFPHLVIDLCGNSSAEPLIACLSRMDAMRDQVGFFDPADGGDDALVRFPQAALATYNETNFGHVQPQPTIQIPNISMHFTEQLHVPGNLSPAFTPAAFEPVHTRASSVASNYLEVPGPGAYQASAGFAHSINNWGTFPSPGFPTQEFFGQDDLLFDDRQMQPLPNNLGASIQPCEIWT